MTIIHGTAAGIALVSMLTGCAGQAANAQEAAGESAPVPFSVSIEQDGETVPVGDHRAELEKKEFALIVHFPGPDTVLVSASFDPGSYRDAAAGKPLAKIRGFSDLGMAEGLFNEERTLFISDTAPNAWYYENEKDHRFDGVTATADGIACRRTIAGFSHPETGEIASVEEIERNSLYLVLVSASWKSDLSAQVERHREFVEIVFH